MTAPIHSIKLFYGFQFTSSNIDEKILEKLINDSSNDSTENLINKMGLNFIEIHPHKYELENTYTIFDSLFNKIDDSDICIFEISDKNPNVFLEMGYAKGKNKYVIPLLNEDLLKEVPSDISGLVTVAYKSLNPMACKDELTNQIIKGVEHIISNRKQAKFFWGSATNTTVKVHIGRDKSKRQINMSDLITFNVLKMNFEIPNNLSLILSDIVSGQDFSENVISLCGPKHNKYFDYFLRDYANTKRYSFLRVKDSKIDFSMNKQLKGDDYIIFDNKNDNYYVSDLVKNYSQGKRTGLTYALIYKIRNKGRDKNNFFVFAGINFEGTISSVEAIFDEEFMSKLGRSINFQNNNLEILLKFDILNGDKSGIELLEINMLDDI